MDKGHIWAKKSDCCLLCERSLMGWNTSLFSIIGPAFCRTDYFTPSSSLFSVSSPVGNRKSTSQDVMSLSRKSFIRGWCYHNMLTVFTAALFHLTEEKQRKCKLEEQSTPWRFLILLFSSCVILAMFLYMVMLYEEVQTSANKQGDDVTARHYGAHYSIRGRCPLSVCVTVNSIMLMWVCSLAALISVIYSHRRYINIYSQSHSVFKLTVRFGDWPLSEQRPAFMIHPSESPCCHTMTSLFCASGNQQCCECFLATASPSGQTSGKSPFKTR